MLLDVTENLTKTVFVGKMVIQMIAVRMCIFTSLKGVSYLNCVRIVWFSIGGFNPSKHYPREVVAFAKPTTNAPLWD